MAGRRNSPPLRNSWCAPAPGIRPSPRPRPPPRRPAAGGGIADGIGPRVGGAEQPERPPRLRHRAAAVGEFQRGAAGRASAPQAACAWACGREPVGQAGGQAESGGRCRGKVGGPPALWARRRRGRHRAVRAAAAAAATRRRPPGWLARRRRCSRAGAGRPRAGAGRGPPRGGKHGHVVLPRRAPAPSRLAGRGSPGLGLNRLPARCGPPAIPAAALGARGVIVFLGGVAADQAGLDIGLFSRTWRDVAPHCCAQAPLTASVWAMAGRPARRADAMARTKPDEPPRHRLTMRPPCGPADATATAWS